MPKPLIEYERKYLGAPEIEPTRESVGITQYYLSHSDEPAELRLRRETATDGTAEYTITLKAGEPPLRTEVETETTAEAYETWLAAKTSDIIDKRRTTIAKAGGAWMIDRFNGSDLIITEAEGEEVEQPEGLPEITKDKSYKNSRLARVQPATPEAGYPVDSITSRITDLQRTLQRPVIIAVAGASGSGKTTAATTIRDLLGTEATILHQDDYYHGKTELRRRNGAFFTPNWDHPEALDLETLATHLEALKNGEPVDQPLYDMVTSDPKVETRHINPHATPVIIVEGIYTLLPEIAEHADLRIYIETPLATRIGRRILREIGEQRTFSPTDNLRYMLEIAEPTYREWRDTQMSSADIITSQITCPEDL